MITFYINANGDYNNSGLRYVKKNYINKYLEPYNIEYKIVQLTPDSNLNREFLLKALSLHDECEGLSALARTGLMDRNSSQLTKLRKNYKTEVTEWMAMLFNKKDDVTVNEVVDMLIKYPILCNRYFTYDDEVNVFSTRHSGDICRNAVRRKSRAIRKEIRMDKVINSGLSFAEPVFE